MPDDFIIRALIAGVFLAAVAGVLGCFIVWRRMAYFGDSLAHGALLGAAAGLLLGEGAQWIDWRWTAAAVCALFAPALVFLRRRGAIADDTALGVLAHGSLAFGLLMAANIPGLDLHSYLLGDILAVGDDDLLWIAAGGGLTIIYVVFCWQSLTLMAVHEDLAASEGVRVLRSQILLTLLTALVVAAAIRIIGALLITSLLIAPAAAARQFATSPAKMAAGAAMVGIIAVFAGVAASLRWDVPTGPAIAASCFVLFALSMLFARGNNQ
ncbi:MAG: metal ABC transporter permease [Gammaproteobacteria bacterium]